MSTPNLFDFNYQLDLPGQEDFPLNLREQGRRVTKKAAFSGFFIFYNFDDFVYSILNKVLSKPSNNTSRLFLSYFENPRSIIV